MKLYLWIFLFLASICYADVNQTDPCEVKKTGPYIVKTLQNQVLSLTNEKSQIERENETLRRQLSDRDREIKRLQRLCLKHNIDINNPVKPDKIVDVFREPFAVGQIGRVDFDKEHPRQRMRINTIIDENNCLVDFKIGTLPSQVQPMGRGYNPAYVDVKALAPPPRLATIEEDFENPLSIIKTIWLKGFKTSGRVDSSEIDNPPILIITGTRTYDTIMGAKRTVYVFEPADSL